MFSTLLSIASSIRHAYGDHDDLIADLDFISRCEDLADEFDDFYPAALALWQPSTTSFYRYYASRDFDTIVSYHCDMQDEYIYIHQQLDELQTELDAVPEWEYFWMPSAT